MLGPLDDSIPRWRTFENTASTEAEGFGYPHRKDDWVETGVENGNGPTPETRVRRIFETFLDDQVVGNWMGIDDRAQTSRARTPATQTETANASERIQANLAASGGRAGDDEGVSVWAEF